MPNNSKLPENSVVLTKTTTKFELLQQEVQVFKIYDDVKKDDYTMTFDDKGKEVNFDNLLKKESELYQKKFGKIHPTLSKTIEKTSSNKLINVAIWVKAEGDEPRKTNYKKSEFDKLSAEILRFRKGKFAEIRQITEKIAKDSKIKIGRVSRVAPVFFAKLNQTQIKLLASNELVSGLFLNDSSGINDLGDSMAISNADDVIDSGFTGNNIKVAVWEKRGPDDITNLSIEEYKRNGFRSGDDAKHARLVCGIIKNTEKDKPHGYAPDCQLFSANDADLDGLEWAVEDKECSVINQSFHRNSEETEGGLSFDDIMKDFIIYNYPYPTIIQAAGNKKTDDGRNDGEEYVNHKGFNSLTVGNHNDSASAMVSSSIYRNPTCNHGDRELPEISANGYEVTAVGRKNRTGTSFASPAVAGSVALLQSIDDELVIWPEGSRAILLAGATINVNGNNWSTDMYNEVDVKDGTGALNIEQSANIAQNRKEKNNIASQQGWDIGVLDSNDFKRDKNANFSYKIRVPENGPKKVKVALAWNSKLTIDFFPVHISSKLKLDLDLWILDENGNRVARSTSYDNSYEIAEYEAKTGQELTIVIRKYSGDDWTYFGIAWTVF